MNNKDWKEEEVWHCQSCYKLKNRCLTCNADWRVDRIESLKAEWEREARIETANKLTNILLDYKSREVKPVISVNEPSRNELENKLVEYINSLKSEAGEGK